MARPSATRYGLARILSKRGLCSRSEATRWILDGRVSIDGCVVRDPEHPTDPGTASLRIDGQAAAPADRIHLMLNKPRGLVTTAADEHGRATVYRCFDGARLHGAPLPWLGPVGRLDKASEGLLLFCNDPQWAARITDPDAGPDKTYHVQVDCVPDSRVLRRLESGVDCDGELLRAKSASLLRSGPKNAWLEVVLDEGRNRQIRRLLASCEIGVLRLVRVAIGTLALGDLPKGQWRMLTPEEVVALAGG